MHFRTCATKAMAMVPGRKEESSALGSGEFSLVPGPLLLRPPFCETPRTLVVVQQQYTTVSQPIRLPIYPEALPGPHRLWWHRSVHKLPKLSQITLQPQTVTARRFMPTCPHLRKQISTTTRLPAEADNKTTTDGFNSNHSTSLPYASTVCSPKMSRRKHERIMILDYCTVTDTLWDFELDQF